MWCFHRGFGLHSKTSAIPYMFAAVRQPAAVWLMSKTVKRHSSSLMMTSSIIACTEWATVGQLASAGCQAVAPGQGACLHHDHSHLHSASNLNSYHRLHSTGQPPATRLGWLSGGAAAARGELACFIIIVCTLLRLSVWCQSGGDDDV